MQNHSRTDGFIYIIAQGHRVRDASRVLAGRRRPACNATTCFSISWLCRRGSPLTDGSRASAIVGEFLTALLPRATREVSELVVAFLRVLLSHLELFHFHRRKISTIGISKPP